MAYQFGHYYINCDPNNCSATVFWFPDGTNDIRNQITAAYFKYFGRYGERAGVDARRQLWIASGGTLDVDNDVYQGGIVSGEQNLVDTMGRHCGMALGGCPPLPSATLSASPSSIIFPGSSTISWSTSGLTSGSITNIGNNLAASGSRTVSPSSTTTYTLTGTGPRGSVTKSVTVFVTYQPPTVSFSASPTSIIIPGTSTLSWSVGGSVSSVSINRGIGNVAASGSRSVSPTSTTTYTITATGAGGTTTRSVTVTASLPPPPTVSFSISPSSVCRGSTATLSWSVGGSVSSVSINQGIGNVAASGSRSVSPTSTTTYTITATGLGGTTTRSVTLTVYQQVSTSITADNATIIRGQCTTLRWTTTGNATGATINQGIGSVNINGNRQVCPTQTTTYTINVSGICNSVSRSVTVTVYQPPTVNLTGPVSLNYNQQGTLQYESTNADISLTLSPNYAYKNGSLSGPLFNVNLPIGPVSNGQITTQIPYNDFGPVTVTYTIVATGNGGQETKQVTIPINIDETPNNFLVPESEDLLKEQAPIFTPDATVTSYEIKIDDIDIPVEVKADKPILIDKNNQQDWKRLRRI